MELPKNTGDIVAKFDGLSKERKDQIVAHFAHLHGDPARAAIDTIIKNGGKEGEFVATLFGRVAKK